MHRKSRKYNEDYNPGTITRNKQVFLEKKRKERKGNQMSVKTSLRLRKVLPSLVQILTWLHVSDYHDFWNNER